MKKIIHFAGFLAALVWLARPPVVNAQEWGRFYVNADLGPSFIQDTTVRQFGVPVSGFTLEFDPGVRFGISAGYHITDWFAAELDTGYLYNAVKNINAELYQAPMLLNWVFQTPRKKPFTAFCGAGIGGVGSYLWIDDLGVNGNDDDLVFAWQAFAGARFQINERMALGLVYKYLETEGPRWDSDFLIETSTVRNHSVGVTFTYKF